MQLVEAFEHVAQLTSQLSQRFEEEFRKKALLHAEQVFALMHEEHPVGQFWQMPFSP